MGVDLCGACRHPRFGSRRGQGHFAGEGPCKALDCQCQAYEPGPRLLVAGAPLLVH